MNAPPGTPWAEVARDESADPGDVASAVLGTVRDIEERQTSIHDGHVRHARMYAGYVPSALCWDSTRGYERTRTEATKSVIRSVCDTATALISRSRPKPTPVTDGAEFSVQQMARLLDRFLVGVYSRSNLYAVAQRCFHDSCWSGTGAWKLLVRGDLVHVERVLPDDLIVDEAECPVAPEPRHVYHRVRTPVATLVRRYPQHEEAIRAARGRWTGWAGGRVLRQEDALVVEAWALPDAEGGEGTRVVVADGVVLEGPTPWRHPWAPVVVLYWAPPISGFYGDGIAYRLLGRQLRINHLYRWVQRCHDLMAGQRVWMTSGAGALKVQISNEIGEIVSAPSKPEFQAPPIVQPEIYQWLDALAREGFEEEGISLASAANRLPPGIESAPAQREYSFKEGQRFAPVSQRWEDAVAQETAYKVIALYRDVAARGGKSTETWSSRRLIQRIPWEDVDLESTRYLIRVEASSLESLSPAGRIQAAIELGQTGWVEPEEGRRLLGHPDLVHSDELGTSGEEEAEWILEELLHNRPVAVDAYSDLQLVYDKVIAGYRVAKTSRAPERTLEHIRGYLRALEEKLNPQAAAGAMGVPMPAPVPAMSGAAAQGLGLPFSNAGGGPSDEGI